MRSANSMRGVDGPGECTISIEGCMEPAAVNYDPLANFNTGTWCVPRVTGCMLPPDGRRSIVTGKETHFSTGWDVTATVHSADLCKGRPTTAGYAPFTKPLTGVKVIRYGCMDPLAANFDAAATVSHTGDYYKCYTTVTGCLNPLALNFGCNAKGTVPCTVEEEENNNGAIIGGVIGGFAGLMLVGGGAYMYMQQRKKTVNVVPA
ncbi:hypothetical protein Ctob_010029 [Chrysochromulina tobinii]|uniref:Uncharacterized protein n=1 Tax=Chrysochromulina tobinii TaxID=1460289 RepID=A0A0M0JYT1_9EUKA|nr:hypothetical protein Ctob_010029 [Chrysochromulina tobinii]|eukprot:KOO31293.1 hypothetical protein Ctob_010029 [Chrysochromulina sp. CCMP291]